MSALLLGVIQASAPGRCGIIGNPSDIYGGFVVSCSIPARAHCRLIPEGSGLPDDLRLWRAATKRFPIGRVGVEWTTDIPRSSGLSGSTALLAATLACVMKLGGREFELKSTEGRIDFAELLRDVELRDAGITCGYQDAYMIVHGGLKAIDFRGKHPEDGGPTGMVTPIDAPLPFLLITTGVERLSGYVHGPMLQRWLAREQDVIHNMKQVADLGRAGAIAIRKQDWPALGGLMNENQTITASLGGSGDEIDKLVAACLELGALGAKLAGAGLGGTVIALSDDPGRLETELRHLGYERFMRPSIEPGVRFEDS